VSIRPSWRVLSLVDGDQVRLYKTKAAQVGGGLVEAHRLVGQEYIKGWLSNKTAFTNDSLSRGAFFVSLTAIHLYYHEILCKH
jgi:hypothetical protein